MVVVLKGRDGSSGQNGTQVCNLLLLLKFLRTAEVLERSLASSYCQ